MKPGSTTYRLTHAIRDVAWDELGCRPPLRICVALAKAYVAAEPTEPLEVMACRVFDAHEGDLLAAAKERRLNTGAKS